MAQKGGPAALRGYRLQTLYSFHRIIGDTSEEKVYSLEGVEDLHVLSSTGEPLEFVQVKAFDQDLTLSLLEPPDATGDTFFRRVLRRHAARPQSVQRLVSVGPIGPELSKAWKEKGQERKSIGICHQGVPNECTN